MSQSHAMVSSWMRWWPWSVGKGVAMADVRRGDKVMATRDIGGLLRRAVRKGTRGVVVAAGWMSPTRVNFERVGEVDVQPEEIARLY